MSTESSLEERAFRAFIEQQEAPAPVGRGELEAKLTAAEKERDAAVTERMDALVARDFADLAHDRAEARAASVERVAGELARALEEIRDGFRSDGYVWAKNGDSGKGGFHRERSDVLYDYANKALTAYKALQPGREKALGNDVRTT